MSEHRLTETTEDRRGDIPVMMRWRISPTTLIVLGLVFVAACKESEPSGDAANINPDWVKRENQLMSNLQRVQKTQTDLDVAFTTLPPADPADTLLGAERNRMQNMLMEKGARLGELQTMIDEISMQRDSLSKTGDQSAMEALWKKAQGDYTSIEQALAELETTYGSLTTQLGKVSVPTAPVDTSGVKVP